MPDPCCTHCLEGLLSLSHLHGSQCLTQMLLPPESLGINLQRRSSLPDSLMGITRLLALSVPTVLCFYLLAHLPTLQCCGLWTRLMFNGYSWGGVSAGVKIAVGTWRLELCLLHTLHETRHHQSHYEGGGFVRAHWPLSQQSPLSSAAFLWGWFRVRWCCQSSVPFQLCGLPSLVNDFSHAPQGCCGD